jgi:heat shock protein HslJ
MRPQSILRFIALIILLVSCGSDETISGYADRKMIYALASIDNAPFTARATIAFAKEGAVNGTRPCNTFQAAQSVPYPWFALGPIASTRRACPDLGQETAYFAALADMRFAEVAETVLILSNKAGGEMVFQAE